MRKIQETAVDRPASRKLTLGQYVAYGCGDFSSNLVWGFICMYQLYFYTDVVGIPARAAGWIVALSRIASAVFDLVIGIGVDLRRGRPEQARPILLYGAAPFGLLTCLAFAIPKDAMWLQEIWALVSAVGLNLAYSTVNISYGAMTNLVTSASEERMKLATSRTAGAALGQILISISAITVIAAFGRGDLHIGFPRFMALIGVIGALLFVITYWFCPETARERQAHGPVRSILLVARSTSWWRVTILMAMNGCALLLVMALIPYCAAYTHGLVITDASMLFTALLVAFLIGSLLLPLSLRKLDERAKVLVFTALQIAPLIFLYLTGIRLGPLLFAIVGYGVGCGAGVAITYGMLADVMDKEEAAAGISLGVCYALNSFMVKLATAVSGLLAAFLIAPSEIARGIPDIAHILTGLTQLPCLMLVIGMVAWVGWTRSRPILD